MKNQRIAALALALALPLSVMSTGVAQATGEADEGCTPGYWKNHTESWDVYTPDTTLGSVFSNAGSLSSDTLLEALDFGGGSTLEEAEMILLRAATAALLNSVDTDVDYPWRTARVIRLVDRALASDDRDTVLSLARRLDRLNNLGCPL